MERKYSSCLIPTQLSGLPSSCTTIRIWRSKVDEDSCVSTSSEGGEESDQLKYSVETLGKCFSDFFQVSKNLVSIHAGAS